MKHAGSRHKGYPSLRRRGLKPVMRQVAIVQTWRTYCGPNGEEMRKFTIELHGAAKVMVKRVIEPLRGTLCKDYTLKCEQIIDRLNGRCNRSMVLTIDSPDLHSLSVEQWLPFIKNRMESLFLCHVTVYDDYTQFLND